mgnify:CR=1 FL=1
MEKLINSCQPIDWPAKGVKAFQTIRALPPETDVNKVDFGNFNLGLHVGDNQDSVLANRQQLNKVLGSEKSIQWLNQVHGTDVALIKEHSEKTITADAAITSNPNIALAVMTADCLPILLSSHCGSEIAVIHAGWRPLAAGIVEKTLSQLKSINSDIVAWLGPCIGQQNFQVGSEVRDAFVNLDGNLIRYFLLDDDDKYRANLRGIARYLLEKNGIVQIQELSDCTYDKKEKYYSYRRCNTSGRMCSVIVME